MTSQYDKKVQPKLAYIRQCKRRGYSDKDLWTLLKISKSTYYSYVTKYPDFADAIKLGKEDANAMVENELLKKSLGYELYEEVEGTKKEKFYGDDGKLIQEVTSSIPLRLKKYKDSDMTAIKYYLNNNDPEHYKDKQDINLGGQANNPLHVKLEDVI